MTANVAIPIVPPLREGDRLTRSEFERRWDAMPEVTKAELIDGVVYMPAAALSIDHGAPHFDMIAWLGMYRMLTPGVGGADNASIRFDDKNMPQPDALLRILETHGGQSRISADRYLEVGPELIAEISVTTGRFDLGKKREVYRRFGVLEYIVWRVPERIVEWFILRDGHYHSLVPGPDGLIRSAAFPGLWLDPIALVPETPQDCWKQPDWDTAAPNIAAFLAELQRRASEKP